VKTWDESSTQAVHSHHVMSPFGELPAAGCCCAMIKKKGKKKKEEKTEK